MKWIFKLFKVSLFILNSFYFLFAIALLIFTAFIYINSNELNDFIKVEYASEYIEFIYGLIIFSGFLLLVGFLGCSGILNEKTWLLTVYFCLLFFIFSIQFVGAIYLYVTSINYFNSFKSKVLYAIKHQYGSSTVHSKTIDYLHYKLKCCGWYSPRDWQDSSYIDPKSLIKTKHHDNVITGSQAFPLKIPHSCCVNNYDFTCVLMHKFHEVGCEKNLLAHYKHIEVSIAWLLAFLNLFQLILLILSLYLLCMVIFNKKTEKQSLNSTGYSDEVVEQHNMAQLYPNFIHNPANNRYYMTSCYL